MACAGPEPAEPPPEPLPADEVGPYAVGASTLLLEDDLGRRLTLELETAISGVGARAAG